MNILGFDPGRDKCGVAIMAKKNPLPLYHQVFLAEDIETTLPPLCQKYGITLIVMGNQTTSKQWQQRLENLCESLPPLTLVDEYNSSQEARDLYWQMYPPKGLQRLIPQGLRLPPRPIDDLVGIILIRRYLAQD